MKKVLIIIMLILCIMFGEHRYIMTHLDIERGNGGTMYVSSLGCTETYYVEGWQAYAYAEYLLEGEGATPSQPAGATTVRDIVSTTSVPFFIVKEVDTLAVLNEDVYMDRKVVEIAMCDDTEDTLCLFIDLAESETQRVREV